MSGHSEWANKKHRKEKSDAKKAKYFTKIGREISVAVKIGGSADPNLNTRLAAAIAKAKQYNMPNDNIARSIKNASGMGDKNNYEEVVYYRRYHGDREKYRQPNPKAKIAQQRIP